MAYTKEIREQVLRELISGVPAGKISRTYQISIPTIYNWKNKYLQNSDVTEESVSKEEDKAIDNMTELVSGDIEANEGEKSNQQENEILSVAEAVQKIVSLKQNGSLEEALSICNHQSYKDNQNILFQKVDTLFLMAIRDNNIEMATEAYKICKVSGFEDKRFTNSLYKILNEFPALKIEEFPILKLSIEELNSMDFPELNKQLQLLVTSGNLEEAINIINESTYRNNPNIVQQKVKALFILGKKNNDMEKIKECYSICLKFKSNPHFQSLMRRIENEFSEIDWSLCQPQEDLGTSESPKIVKGKDSLKFKTKKDSDDLIKELLTKIHCDFITASEIEAAEIDEWYKDLLMLAFLHKKSRENALFLAKKLKEKYCQDEPNEQRIKILNKLVERIKIKKGIAFDVNAYVPYLPVYFNFDLVNQTLKEKALKESQEIAKKPKAVQNLQIAAPVPDSTRLHKKPEKRMVVVEGKPVTARYQQITSSTQGISSEKTKKLKIKDVFEPEIFEIGKLLYVQMQKPRNVKRGCRAWDTLELLKEKSASDEWAVRRILSLIAILDIKTNQERNDRIYQELEERRKQRMEAHEQQKIKNIGVNN